MKNWMRKSLFFVVTIVIVCISAKCFEVLSSGLGHHSVRTDGGIDISDWDYDEDTTISLGGSWEFYWKQLITMDDIEKGIQPDRFVKVPEVWNDYKIDNRNLPGFGFATYRVHVSGVRAGSPVSLYIPTISTAYNLYIDNQFMASSGNVSKDSHKGKAEYKPVKIVFTPEKTSFDIIVQVSNHMYARGGMWYAMYLGTPSKISQIENLSAYRDMFVIGGYFMMIVLFLAVYINRRQEKAGLYIAGIALIAMCRTLFHGSYLVNSFFPDIPFPMMIRLDYLTLFWFPVSLQMIVKELFPDSVKKSFIIFLFCLEALLSLLVFITPVYIFTRFIYLAELIIVLNSLYLYAQIYNAMLKRSPNARLIYVAYTIVVLAGVYDILLQASETEYAAFEYTPLAMLVLLVIQAYILARKFKNALEEKEMAIIEIKESLERENKAELKFLQSQIHPHFIYNTLNTIISVSRKDVHKAQKLLLEFGNYLRGCFDFKDVERYISVKKEIEFVESYIILQQARFGDRIKITYEIEDMEMMIPPLVLQPLVENAVTHGIRQKPEGGTITVYGVRGEGYYRMGVKDDGVGIAAERLDDILNGTDSGRGIAIYNITGRLQKMYGIVLQVENVTGGGTNVFMDLPDKGGSTYDQGNAD